ncbi:hypothetical protein F4779DRAFT_600633 [Xylariaceae sp. FL0662B]|nr:hypothetical protein F4779DRAFT_600633 [Xylariaceae sp. FL0662B]
MSGDDLAKAYDRHSSDAQTHPAPGLRRSSKALLWGVIPCMLIALLIASPLMIAFLPVILLPTLGLAWHNNAQPSDRRVDAETLIWTYVSTGTLGTVAVIVVQSIVSYAVAWVLFGRDKDAFLAEMQRQESDITGMDAESLATRQEMAGSWPYWVFMFVFAFGVAGLVEEVLKYSALPLARRHGRVAHEYNYVVLAAAGALGFSTFENIGFVYAAARAEQSLSELALTLAERVLVGSPGHVTGAVLIGLNAALRDFHAQPLSLTQIIGVPVVFHGVFDFMLFSISALDGNVGWVHPRGKTLVLVLVLVVAIQGTQAAIVRRRYTKQKTAMDRSHGKSQ